MSVTHTSRPEVAKNGPTTVVVLFAMAFAFATPFDPIPLLMGRSLGFPFGISLVVLVVLNLLGGRRAGRVPAPLQRLLGLYMLWVTFTMFWSVAPDASVATGIQLLFRVAFLAALCFVIPSHFSRLVKCYALGAAALGLALVFYGEEEYTGRITLMEADQNALGLSLTVGFGIALTLVLTSKGLGRLVWLAAAGCMAYGVVLTGSRTGFLALGIGLLAPLVTRLSFKRLLQVAVALFAALLALRWALARGLIPDRVERFLETGETANDERASIIDRFLGMPDWMTFGVGLQADADYLEMKTGVFAYVHNLFFGAWVQLGYIGVLLLIAIVVSVFWHGWKSPRRDVFVAGFLPMLVYAMTLPGQTSNVYWFVFALGAAVFAVPPEADEADEADKLQAEATSVRKQTRRTL